MTDRPAKILIVDDEELNLLFIQEVLADEHCILSKARDGVEAVDKFEKFQPDLVLLDLLLPRLTGLEVCAHIKHVPGAETVPIIILSSLDELEARRDAYECGADGFVHKPFDPSVLLHQVRKMLHEAQRRRAAISARHELAEVLAELEQVCTATVKPTTPHLSAALDACKRLDRTLAGL